MPSHLLQLLSSLPHTEVTPSADVIADPILFWWQWVMIALAALFIISIILLVLIIWKNRPQPVIPALKNYLTEIESLNSSDLTQSEFAVQLSIQIRSYLNEITSDDSLFQTKQELQRQQLSSLPLSPTLKNTLLEFLMNLSDLKYNPTPQNFNSDTIAKEAIEMLKDVDSQLQQLEPQKALKTH